MEVLGGPTEEDLSFITDQTAINYLKEFPPHSKGIDLQ
jgi:serine/threonine protein kinase